MRCTNRLCLRAASSLLPRALLALFTVLLLSAAAPARADIYEWVISGGSIVQSNTVCSGGSGVTAAPAANLSGRNLSNAYLLGANCTGANFNNAVLLSAALQGANLSGGSIANANFGYTTSLGFSASQLYATANYAAGNLSGIGLSGNNLSGWNFANQHLTNANLSGSTLAGASLTGAFVAGADLSYTTSAGFTAAQLYSTTSYQSGNLNGLFLDGNDLTNWNFAGQNLSAASFAGVTLAGANLSGSTIAAANFASTTQNGLTAAQIYATASYAARNLGGVSFSGNDLTNWSFSGQNLSNADFGGATLADTDFTGATIAGASFVGAVNFTPQQLYATASYQAKNLSGIEFFGNDLSGWNFAGQDLAGAFLTFATLTNANLMHANLTGALFSDANLNAADFRGATGLSSTSNATLVDTIQPSGTIAGLQLSGAGQPLLVIRNDPAASPVAIQVAQGMTVGTGGTLQVLLDDNPWNSTVSFASSIPVALGGQLLLGADCGVNPVALVGKSYQVFNWTGVAPGGQFQIASGLPGNFAWNTSGLYSAGTVSLAGTLTWNGAGSDANFSTSANWSGFALGPYVTLAFDGSNNLNPFNNFTANSQFNGIVFPTTAAAFTLSGNAVQLLGDVVNNSSNPQTINLALNLLGDTNVVTNGNLSLGGNINGAFGLIASGSGTLILSGSNGYSGTTIIEDGTLIAESPAALPDGGNVVIGDAGAFSESASAAGLPSGAAAVPEPGTLVLFLAAGALALIRPRFRRR